MELHPILTPLALAALLALGGVLGWRLRARGDAVAPVPPAAPGRAECVARLDELAKTVARRRLTAQESAELKVLLVLKAEFDA